MQLSVVVPVLNEAAVLPVLLRQLRDPQDLALEIIVADGGSTDGSAALAAQAGARVVTAPRGRGAQMNAGARAATAPWLLFLHADSQLTAPRQLRDAIDAMAHAGPRTAGHFALRFARGTAGHALFFRVLEEKTALNRPGTVNGDQGLLISSEYFRELGGFDERLPFLEDARIAARIERTGRWRLLPGELVTSARRFETEGVYRRYTLMSLIMGLEAAGADEFFARAPQVYAAHGETGRLRLGPYLALTWRVLIDAGWRRALQILFRASRYTRRNSWQPFFWGDVALRRAGRPFLRFHDGYFRLLTDNVPFDLIATAVVSLWFLVVLPPVFAVLDGPAPPRRESRRERA